MPPVVFATAEDLAAFLPAGSEVSADDADRILTRASQVIAEAATTGYYVDDDGKPVNSWDIEALRDATCAQVEQWLEVGEENDIAGFSRGAAISLQGLNLSSLPSTVAPRAKRILKAAGLAWARAF